MVSLDEPVRSSLNSSAFLDVPDSQPSPEITCAARETEEAVQRALNALSYEFRIVVVLRDIEGLSYEEIAELLKISLGTVKSRLCRGRMELKKRLHNFVNDRYQSLT